MSDALTQVWLFTLAPVAAMAVGGAVAAFRPPGARLGSAVQHFAAGVVFAAVAVELLPDVVHRDAPLAAAVGFALGVALMLGLRALARRWGGEAGEGEEGGGGGVGLVLIVGVDILIDGLLMGVALAIELLSLGLATAANLKRSGPARADVPPPKRRESGRRSSRAARGGFARPPCRAASARRRAPRRAPGGSPPPPPARPRGNRGPGWAAVDVPQPVGVEQVGAQDRPGGHLPPSLPSLPDPFHQPNAASGAVRPARPGPRHVDAPATHTPAAMLKCITGSRWRGHSVCPRGEGGEPDEAGEVGGLLLVPRRHAAALLDPAEEPPDHVAVPVPRLVVAPLALAGRVRLHARAGPSSASPAADRVAVVRGVGEHMLRAQPLQQRRGLRGVAAPARRDDQPQRAARAAHRGVQLGRQPPARAAEAPPRVGVGFFPAGRGGRVGLRRWSRAAPPRAGRGSRRSPGRPAPTRRPRTSGRAAPTGCWACRSAAAGRPRRASVNSWRLLMPPWCQKRDQSRCA